MGYTNQRDVERKITQVNEILQSINKNLSISCEENDVERGCITLHTKNKRRMNKINSESRYNKLRFTQFAHSSDKIHALELVEILLKLLSDKPIQEGNFKSGCGRKRSYNNKDLLVF